MTMWFSKGRSILTQEQPEEHSSPFAYKIDDLQAWLIGNWLQIPEPERRLLVDHLRKRLRNRIDGPMVLARWTAQVRMGVPIGGNDTWFHFGAGMEVRNLLRDVMTDDKLPLIRQPDGSMGQNWDDFYLGAIHALVTDQSVEVNEKVPSC